MTDQRANEGATGIEGVPFRHVDVFADSAFTGNGLIVMFSSRLDFTTDQLLTVTQEMRQFESIYVSVDPGSKKVAARVFTVEEELPFAGHPLLGAAAALHERTYPDVLEVVWEFVVQDRRIPVVSRRDSQYFAATMDQGPAEFGRTLAEESRGAVAAALNLTPAHLPQAPMQVISTGLPYLIVPVTGAGLGVAKIVDDGFETLLGEFGAKFVFVLDPKTREGRTWDNAGVVEDIATGSSAGPAAAYLQSNGFADIAQPVQLSQGRFVGRSSQINVNLDARGHLWVGGPVRPVATGALDALPT